MIFKVKGGPIDKTRPPVKEAYPVDDGWEVGLYSIEDVRALILSDGPLLFFIDDNDQLVVEGNFVA